MRDCGVTGDSKTDDQPALAACLAKHRDVFLPKGRYRLGKTLDLNAGNRLVGLGQTLSVLMPLSRGFAGATAEAPQPVVRTAEGSPAVIAFVGIVSWWHLQLYTMHWRSRGGLWRANYETRVCECVWLSDYGNATGACTTAVELAVPKTKVQGTGAFVNFVSDEDILMTDHIHCELTCTFSSTPFLAPACLCDSCYSVLTRKCHLPDRHLHVSQLGNTGNSRDRLRFYMLNLEHGQSQSNFEVQNASFVDVYGIKLEGSTTIMWVRDSHDINLWGLGGSGDAFPNCGGSTGIACKIPFDFHIPADFPPYNFSTIRVER